MAPTKDQKIEQLQKENRALHAHIRAMHRAAEFAGVQMNLMPAVNFCREVKGSALVPDHLRMTADQVLIEVFGVTDE